MNTEKSKLIPSESPSTLLLSPSYLQSRIQGIRTPVSSAFYISRLFEGDDLSSSRAECIMCQSVCSLIHMWSSSFGSCPFLEAGGVNMLFSMACLVTGGNGTDWVGTGVSMIQQLWRHQDCPLPREWCTMGPQGHVVLLQPLQPPEFPLGSLDLSCSQLKGPSEEKIFPSAGK